MTNETYQNPLISRYASKEMSHLFSPQVTYSTWRTLWTTLAEVQKSLGLSISDEQIKELRAHINTIDFSQVAVYEKETQHDVAAHIRTYAEQCPTAAPIIHLGCTSCFVKDNTELIQMKEGLRLLLAKLATTVRQFSDFALKEAQTPCLGYTHLQPAQLTTVGKRACIWIQDLLLDLQELNYRKRGMKFLGIKGANGTQATYLTLFQNDHDKVRALDENLAEKMGFKELLSISGQTYTRKQDSLILSALSQLAATAHKIGTDLRLLTGLGALEEPFTRSQVGSSAMPHKRNPIHAERMCSLSRLLMGLAATAPYTHATQWLERSLDDSAIRRITIPEAFLAADAILNELLFLTKGIEVFPKTLEQQIEKELPFIATENILTACTSKGKNRQELHEKLREYARNAAETRNKTGETPDILLQIAEDDSFPLTQTEIQEITKPKHFIGRAKEQTESFIHEEVEPLLSQL